MLRIVVVLCVVMLSACSPAKVLNREQADGVSLSSYKTFDFYSVQASGDTVSRNFNDRVTRIQDAIALKLQNLGYLLSKTNPDISINIGIAVDDKLQTRQTDFRTDAPRYAGQRRYSWKSEEVETGSYREGTVTVHMVDTKQNKMVWKGAVQGVIPRKESSLDATIKKGINKLLADYPQAAAK